jgi:prolyl-tRNA synthetase
VPVTAVNADVGAMGGKTSQEFVVAHEQGEDSFIRCQSCDYAANVETAEFVREGDLPTELTRWSK